MVHGIVGCYRIQGLLKGEKLNLYPDFFCWLEKYSLHVENKSKDVGNKISLLLQDLGFDIKTLSYIVR